MKKSFCALTVALSFGLNISIQSKNPVEFIEVLSKVVPNKSFIENSLKKLTAEKGYCVLFSPDDAVHKTMLHLIEQEKKGIKIAIYTLTDSLITNALIAAVKRGIRVDILTDQKGLRGYGKRFDQLYNNGAHIYIYNPEWNDNNEHGIMHNKFIIFEQNIQDRSFVWTGSYNFTRSARQVNQENVVILNRLGAAKKFQNQFNILLHRSNIYTQNSI
jgi:mitochondrial cardiolipin hydrolase